MVKNSIFIALLFLSDYCLGQTSSYHAMYSVGAKGQLTPAAKNLDIKGANIAIAGWEPNFPTGPDIFIETGDTCSGEGVKSSYFSSPGNFNDIATGVRIATDGDLWVCGNTDGMGAGGADGLLLRLDTTGGLPLVFARTFGGAAADGFYALDVTSDGGAILTGETSSFGAGGSDGYVVKVDAAGTLQWSVAIGGPANDVFYDVVQTSDGGYFLVGSTGSFPLGSIKVFMVKLDATGAGVFSNVMGGTLPFVMEGYSVEQTSDGGYIIGGLHLLGGSDAWIAKLNAAGALVWELAQDGSGNEVTLDISQTDDDNDGVRDDGYIAAGYSDSYGSGDDDFYYFKTDAAGTLVWAYTNDVGSNEDQLTSVEQVSYDAGYAFTGIINPLFGANLFVLKTHRDGTAGFFCPLVSRSPFLFSPGSPPTSVVPVFTAVGASMVATPSSSIGLAAIAACCCSGWPGGGGCTILPSDDFLYFHAHSSGGMVHLSWKTVTPDISEFIILAGPDPLSMTEIGSHGKEVLHHLAPKLPQHFYFQVRARLTDGSMIYSSVQQIADSENEPWWIENPLLANDERLTVRLSLSAENRALSFTILDIHGKVISLPEVLLSPGIDKFTFTLPDLPPGLYYLSAAGKMTRFVITE